MKISDLPFALDFGEGQGLTWVTNDQEDVIGAIEYHITPEGKRCEGMISFNVPERDAKYNTGNPPLWDVPSWDPLTLSPSVLCRVCGHHGWVRDGKWVPA